MVIFHNVGRGEVHLSNDNERKLAALLSYITARGEVKYCQIYQNEQTIPCSIEMEIALCA